MERRREVGGGGEIEGENKGEMEDGWREGGIKRKEVFCKPVITLSETSRHQISIG